MSDCQLIQQYLEIFALEESDCVEVKLVRDHLQHCEACRLEVQELREAWSMLPANLVPVEPSATMEAKLMARLQMPEAMSLRQEPNWQNQESHPLVRYHWLRYPLAATILIGLASLLYFSTPLGEQQVELAEVDEQLESLAEALEKIDLIKRDFGSPQLQYVTLHAVQPQARARAYLVYDFVAREAHFLAKDLQTLADESVYKLWLLDQDHEVLSSSTFLPDVNQYGAAVIALPQSLTLIDEVLLTREASADAIKPSDAIELRSQFTYSKQ